MDTRIMNILNNINNTPEEKIEKLTSTSVGNEHRILEALSISESTVVENEEKEEEEAIEEACKGKQATESKENDSEDEEDALNEGVASEVETESSSAYLSDSSEAYREDLEEDFVSVCLDCGVNYLGDDIECPQCGSTNTEIAGEVFVDEISDLDPYIEKVEELNVYVESEPTLTEATKKVVRGGKLVTMKVKTKKTRLSSKQKKALAKARKKAHTSNAKKARAKSMKIRRTRLKESVNESLIVVNSPKSRVVRINTELSDMDKPGILTIDEDAYNLDAIADELGFMPVGDHYELELDDSTLVLDTAEGDMFGVVLYAIDEDDIIFSQYDLEDILDESGFELDDFEDEDEDEVIYESVSTRRRQRNRGRF